MKTLRDYRKDAKLTQAELAVAAGIRQATLSSLENGRSTPHPKTIQSLAEVLGLSTDEIKSSVLRSQNKLHKQLDPTSPSKLFVPSAHEWSFLKGLDDDLRKGLANSLIAEWTHTSTALEGNTISAGDTLFVLTEGMTIQGKSLREHQELHGHAQALALISALAEGRQPVRIQSLHELHRAVQTGAVIDSLSPVGSWKVEQNGTMVMTTAGSAEWHEYARASQVPALMQEYLDLITKFTQHPLVKGRVEASKNETEQFLISAYTDLHLAFTGIHPYADGNGRIARLLANIPILCAGFPPLLIAAEHRREYINLMGDYSLQLGQPEPGLGLLHQGKFRDILRDFFSSQWNSTLATVAAFHQRQQQRNASK